MVGSKVEKIKIACIKMQDSASIEIPEHLCSTTFHVLIETKMTMCKPIALL
jgi:hypothetical protein